MKKEDGQKNERNWRLWLVFFSPLVLFLFLFFLCPPSCTGQRALDQCPLCATLSEPRPTNTHKKKPNSHDEPTLIPNNNGQFTSIHSNDNIHLTLPRNTALQKAFQLVHSLTSFTNVKAMARTLMRYRQTVRYGPTNHRPLPCPALPPPPSFAHSSFFQSFLLFHHHAHIPDGRTLIMVTEKKNPHSVLWMV